MRFLEVAAALVTVVVVLMVLDAVLYAPATISAVTVVSLTKIRYYPTTTSTKAAAVLCTRTAASINVFLVCVHLYRAAPKLGVDSVQWIDISKFPYSSQVVMFEAVTHPCSTDTPKGSSSPTSSVYTAAFACLCRTFLLPNAAQAYGSHAVAAIPT